MSDRERAVVILSDDGERVLYTSTHCRIVDNPDGSCTITDLSLGPPPWVRMLAANEDCQDLPDYVSKGAARRALGIDEPLPLISGPITRFLNGFAGVRPKPSND